MAEYFYTKHWKQYGKAQPLNCVTVAFKIYMTTHKDF